MLEWEKFSVGVVSFLDEDIVLVLLFYLLDGSAPESLSDAVE